MNINSEIAKIIQSRQVANEKIDIELTAWKARQKKGETLKAELADLRNICQRALDGTSSDDGSNFSRLVAYLDEIDSAQTIRDLQANSSYALQELERLKQRFCRSTINIVVAGVGRCGKSTALKAIIGQKQDDNSTIPSGNGTAITAGKSIIRCVTTAEEEKTVVQYHTVESFLNELVNPLLRSIGVGEKYQYSNADGFSALKYDELHEAFERAKAEAVSRRTENQVCQVDSASFQSKEDLLKQLHDIMKAFPSFQTRLTGEKDTVPLNQTYRFVSYPQNGETALCYAVKECRIYSRFPNNEVQSLELTDRPGLGTSSEREKKCFIDGLNYAVDLALMIRRPEALFQNFPTELDLRVMDILCSTFGENHLHECMLLFQNDTSLPNSDPEKAYKAIEDWNASRPNPLTVIRGSAFDSEFMQKTLLPTALEFIAKNLPALDQALTDEVLPSLKKKAMKFDAERDKISSKLARLKHDFRSGSGANAINEQTERILNSLMNGIADLLDYYEVKFTVNDSTLSDAVEAQSQKVEKWLTEEYGPEASPKKVEEAKNAIRQGMSARPYANKEIHAIRIGISEFYSELEKIHEALIAEMQSSVAGLLHKCFPSLLAEDAGLDAFIEIAAKTGECPEIIDAIQILNSLEAPFYNIIYPDLRTQVFDPPDKVGNIDLPEGKTQDEQAVFVLTELQNIGMNWKWKAEKLLYSQSKIIEIICAALERFQDRMTRNPETKREMTSFVEAFWGDIQKNDTAYDENIRTKLEKILEG